MVTKGKSAKPKTKKPAKKGGKKKDGKKSKKVLSDKTVPELRKELKKVDPDHKLSKNGKPLKKTQLVSAIKHCS
jgi:hypothetical protein